MNEGILQTPRAAIRAANAPSPSGTVALTRPDDLPLYTPAPANRFKSSIARLFLWLLECIAALFRTVWPLSALWPVPSIFGLRLVVQYDHVLEVLNRHDAFEVPFGKEIARLNDGSSPGTRFLLGIDEPSEHAAQLKVVMKVFSASDVKRRVADLAFASAAQRLERVEQPFNAIRELITAVPLDICNDYYGVRIEDGERDKFAYAAIDLSGHLFGKPPIKEGDKQVDAAGAYVRAIVDRSIRSGGVPDTIVARLVGEYGADPDADKKIRSLLIGMIIGFVPTDTMAGGHILEMLLTHQPMLDAAKNAANEGDDERLSQCLFEALRFMPINLGPFRTCGEEAQLIGRSRIPAHATLLPMTSSAMLDKRRVVKPHEYNPTRPASDHLHFGFGIHWCVGALIARAQIT